MKVLLLTEYFPSSNKAEITGGVENRVYHISKELAKNNEVYVISSLQPELKKDIKINGVNIHRIGPVFTYTSTGNLVKRVLFGLNLMLKLPFFIKKNKIDVVDAQSFFCYPSSVFAKKPFITYHEVWLNNWIKNTRTFFGLIGEVAERFVLLFAKLLSVKIIAVSEFTKNKLVKNGISKNKITVARNGIDLNKYKQTKIKKTGFPTLCFVGRLVEHKRVKDIITAIFILKKKFPKIKCKIIGDGPDKNKLIKLTKRLGLSKNIEYLGFLKKHDRVIKTIKSSHLLIHPGTVEGFGITLLESMACGTPYVCSDITVFKEVTENGKGGLIFKQKNAEDLADKISTLLRKKQLYKKKVMEGKKLVRKYDWKAITKKLETIYKKSF